MIRLRIRTRPVWRRTQYLKEVFMSRSLRNLVTAIAVVAAAAAVAGCKKKEKSTEMVVRIEPTEENLCSQYAEVICHNAFQCCVGNELEETFGIEITTTEETCRRDIELICEEEFAKELYSLGLNPPRVQVDTALVENCLNLILAPEDECFPMRQDDMSVWSECISHMKVFVGQVAAGGECLWDVDCAANPDNPEHTAVCDVDRRCKLLPAATETCGRLSCADGLYCDTDLTTLANTCAARIAEGNGCNYRMPCVEDLFCQALAPEAIDTEQPLETRITGTCAARLADGQPCAGDGDCLSYECLPGVCSDESGECYTNDDCTGTCSASGLPCNLTTQLCTGSFCNGGQEYAYVYDTDSQIGGYQVVDLTGEACVGDICGGTCSMDTDANCLGDTDCNGYCTDTDGTTLTATTCEYAELYYTDCPTFLGAGSVCSEATCDGTGVCEAETCENIATCGGEPVCAAAVYALDYCHMGLHLLDVSEPDTDTF